jgi:hypothetical protein
MKLLTKWVILPLILAMLVPWGVTALATYNGGQVIIDHPVPDDVFASGGTVDINAPVHSLIAAGGMININAPVAGDVIAAGGTINVNSDIGGKLVAAGGNININSLIGTNAVVTGGQVNIGKSATIERDALVSGGQVINAGQVTGNLTVRAQSFDNQGTAGNLDIQLSEPRHEFSRIFGIFGIIFTIGMFILGLVLLTAAPKRFIAVEEELRKSAIVKTIVGFFAIIISLIVLVLVSITVVFLPLALLFWMIFFLALLLSTLFISLALGRVIARYVKWEARPWQMFVIGFIVLNLIFRIPVVGIIILVISVSLGFAAFFWTLHQHWDEIRGEKGEG